MLAMPYLVGFAVWIAIPIIASLVFSFFQYDIVTMKWIGIQNYIRAFTGDRLLCRADRGKGARAGAAAGPQ